MSGPTVHGHSCDHHKDVLCPSCSPSITMPYPGTNEEAAMSGESRQWECQHRPRCADAACSYNPAMSERSLRDLADGADERRKVPGVPDDLTALAERGRRFAWSCVDCRWTGDKRAGQLHEAEHGHTVLRTDQ